MSIFRASKDCTIDDSVALTCTIESAYNLKDHTEYSLRVQSGCIPDQYHHVTKRYSDFAALDSVLRGYGIDFSLPPKKVFGKMDSDFIEQRQRGLQDYITQVLAHPWVSRCLDVKVFVCPKLYFNLDLHETALQNVSMFLRSEDRWRASALLPHIGWRLRKCFLSAVDTSRPKEKYLLTWCMSGDERCFDDRELEQSMKVLTSLQHPGLEPMLFATCNSTCTVVIRKYYEHGTIRDIICNAKPTLHFVKKYARPKSFNIMPVNSVRLFGRQLLETLRFLHDKGFPYVHIHAGNVIIDGDSCRLLDLENSLLGLPTLHRRVYSQLHKLHTIESLTVYCFGHLIYEISTGKPLETLHCDNISYTCPQELRAVLELTLSSAAIKSGLPSISDLLQHPFFSGVSLPPNFPGNPNLKIPAKLRETFRGAQSYFEQRLRSEQDIIHQYRRLARAQAFLMSDEEKRRRRLQKIRSMSQASNPDSPPTNGVSSLSLTVPSDGDNQLTVHSEEVKQSDTSSSVSSPFSPSAGTSDQESTAGSEDQGNEVATSTAGSSGAMSSQQSQATGRSALLSAINGFSKSSLRRVKSAAGNDNDETYSQPQTGITS